MYHISLLQESESSVGTQNVSLPPPPKKNEYKCLECASEHFEIQKTPGGSHLTAFITTGTHI